MSHQKADELTKTVACEPEMRAGTSGIPANEHPPQPSPHSRAHAMNCIRASPEELQTYLVHLDQTHLSEAQKIELLQALWSTMSTFVDLAFGVDPVQQAQTSRRARQNTGEVASSSGARKSNSRADDTQGNSTSAKRG